MNCLCGKEMTKTSGEVEVRECYPGGYYGTSTKEQHGYKCQCGLFLGVTGAVFNDKTYPYWKYDSDDVKQVMGIE